MKKQFGSKKLFILSALAVAGGGASSAQTVTVLKRFDGTNGSSPMAPVVQGLDGNIYGTTTLGGVNQNGTFFKITPAGALTTLYNYCNLANCLDGGGPPAGLLLAPSGVFYGVTEFGGTSNLGTIFRMTPGGLPTTIYNFCTVTNCPDGAQPATGLFQGSDGEFYGTTIGGSGTLYKINSAGQSTLLHSFCANLSMCPDGFDPRAVPLQGTDGKYYGTTESGGAFNGGTVFKVTQSSGALTPLYSFCATAGCPDGYIPSGGVVEGADANYYGTTAFGGITSSACPSGCGTVYRITSAGVLTTLHNFVGTDGSGPRPLVRANDNNFYGVTGTGGVNNEGTIFEITPDGTFTLYTVLIRKSATAHSRA